MGSKLYRYVFVMLSCGKSAYPCLLTYVWSTVSYDSVSVHRNWSEKESE